MIAKITFISFILFSTAAFSNTNQSTTNFITKSSLKPKRAWDQNSNPTNIFQNKTIEKNFFNLKTSNHMPKQPWSDSYWPSFQGGIAYNWITKETPFEIDHDENFYRNLSAEEIAKLSPAEKFDILKGRYDVPTYNSEKNRTSPKNPEWEGLCHGWAPAALLFDEPKPITLTNPDGLEISFGSSDIKALLIYYTANQYELEGNVTSLFAGNRCNDKDPSNCINTNAGAFHLLITNMINKKIPMVMDIDKGIEVWNQPVYGYTITRQYENSSISPKAAKGTVRQFTIEMQVEYAQEAFQSWNEDVFLSESLNLKYTIELDANNKIIGGEWLSSKRPDFIWTMSRPDFSAEYFGSLKELYNNSIDKDDSPSPSPSNDSENTGSTNTHPTSRNGINIGDLVLETFQHKSLAIVKEISENGDFYLTGGDEGNGGDWYSRENIQKIVTEFDGISTNDSVLETYQHYSITTVKHITEKGLYFLVDGDETNAGDWYSRDTIKKLVDNYNGFYLGETVLEVYQYASYAKIEFISENGLFYLRGGDEGAGGDWYGIDYIRKH